MWSLGLKEKMTLMHLATKQKNALKCSIFFNKPDRISNALNIWFSPSCGPV